MKLMRYGRNFPLLLIVGVLSVGAWTACDGDSGDEDCEENEVACGDTCCSGGQICDNGACVDDSSCEANQTACGDECCNAGQSCDNGACVDGSACDADQTACGDECCDAGQSCDNGTCVDGNACNADQTACGDECCDAGQSCDNGTCVDGNACNADQTACGDECCDAGQSCDNGTCVDGDACNADDQIACGEDCCNKDTQYCDLQDTCQDIPTCLGTGGAVAIACVVEHDATCCFAPNLHCTEGDNGEAKCGSFSVGSCLDTQITCGDTCCDSGSQICNDDDECQAVLCTAGTTPCSTDSAYTCCQDGSTCVIANGRPACMVAP